MSTLGGAAPKPEGKPKNRVTGQRIPWRRDPVVLARMAEVQRRHAFGETNVAIAAGLEVDESVIRSDLKRLGELWTERIGAEAEVLRGLLVTELDQIKAKALAAAEFDEMCERAVLFGEDAEGNRVSVNRDDKGSVQFRGNKAAALNTARQALMDKAKVLGIIPDKPTTDRDAAAEYFEWLIGFGKTQRAAELATPAAVATTIEQPADWVTGEYRDAGPA